MDRKLHDILTDGFAKMPNEFESIFRIFDSVRNTLLLHGFTTGKIHRMQHKTTAFIQIVKSPKVPPMEHVGYVKVNWSVNGRLKFGDVYAIVA